MSAPAGVAQASHRQSRALTGAAWMAQAACVGLPDEFFFPDESANIPDATRRVCARCTVRGECLAYALNHGEWHGVWGGKSVRERRELARREAAS